MAKKKAPGKSNSVKRTPPEQSEKAKFKADMNARLMRIQKEIQQLQNQKNHILEQVRQIDILLERKSGALTEVSNISSSLS